MVSKSCEKKTTRNCNQPGLGTPQLCSKKKGSPAGWKPPLFSFLPKRKKGWSCLRGQWSNLVLLKAQLGEPFLALFFLLFISFSRQSRHLSPQNRHSSVATRATIYRSLRALRAQNRKKVSKRVFLRVCKKVPEDTQNSQKMPPKVQFCVVLTFSGIFGDLFADPQKDSFWDFFAILGPEGPGAPVNGCLGRNLGGQKGHLSCPNWHFQKISKR